MIGRRPEVTIEITIDHIWNFSFLTIFHQIEKEAMTGKFSGMTNRRGGEFPGVIETRSETERAT